MWLNEARDRGGKPPQQYRACALLALQEKRGGSAASFSFRDCKLKPLQRGVVLLFFSALCRMGSWRGFVILCVLLWQRNEVASKCEKKNLTDLQKYNLFEVVSTRVP